MGSRARRSVALSGKARLLTSAPDFATCPVTAAGYARCPECGYEFQPSERQKHDARVQQPPYFQVK
jgi:hypothetical protein